MNPDLDICCLMGHQLTIQSTNDFDRFKIMVAKKQRRDLARKAFAKERKASA